MKSLCARVGQALWYGKQRPHRATYEKAVLYYSILSFARARADAALGYRFGALEDIDAVLAFDAQRRRAD
jgi:hypothetical protein